MTLALPVPAQGVSIAVPSAGSDTGKRLAELTGVAMPATCVIARCPTTVLPLMSFDGVEIEILLLPSAPFTIEKFEPAIYDLLQSCHDDRRIIARRRIGWSDGSPALRPQRH